LISESTLQQQKNSFQEILIQKAIFSLFLIGKNQSTNKEK